MKIGSCISYNRLALIWLVVVFAGCAAAPQKIIQPTPKFGWEPPSKAQPKGINLALVSPGFSRDSSFRSYKGNHYLKTYLSSFQTDLQSILIAKGFSVTGPYEDFDMMTFPNRKGSPLALVPELVLIVDEDYTNTYSNDDGSYIKKEGSIKLNGFIKFSMIEPISEQKIWIKKINLPEQEEPILVDLMYSSGKLNPLNANKDNRDAALVNMLNDAYPEVMKKLWAYLDEEEIEMMIESSKDARARKGY